MVVMAISKAIKFLQCVLICRHPEMSRQSSDFYETHVAVVDKRKSNFIYHGLVQHDQTPVGIIIEDPGKYALREHCYINIQHIWTVRRETMFRNIGEIDDFKRLKEDFWEAQKMLYGYI